MDQSLDFQQLSQMSDQDLTNLFGVRDFFTYEVDFSSIAAAGTAQGSFTVQADSNFLWQYGAMYVDIGSDLTTGAYIPMVSGTIKDSSSGRDLMSAAVPVGSIFGTGQLPFLLPTPRFFRAQTTVTLSLSNFSSNTAYRLRFSFIGTKFFKFAQRV